MGHGRPEDQPLPIGNDLPHTHDIAAEDLVSRKELGISRYGQPLQPANGRDAVKDAYEEALDGAAYLAQVKWEQEHPEHTYVGRIIEALYWKGDVPINFGGVFVPQAVLDFLAEEKMDYVL